MSLWRQLTRGGRALVRREAADRDIDDEVAHYFEEAAAELEAQGMPSEGARRAARRELGPQSGVVEQVRGYGWERTVGALAADLRHGARRMVRQPATAIVAAVTIAIGIGASTAIFSAVRPVLLDSLPYPEAGRLMTIWDRDDGDRVEVTFGTYRELADRSRTFDALAVVRPLQLTLTGVPEPERLEGQYVSAGFRDHRG